MIMHHHQQTNLILMKLFKLSVYICALNAMLMISPPGPLPDMPHPHIINEWLNLFSLGRYLNIFDWDTNPHHVGQCRFVFLLLNITFTPDCRQTQLIFFCLDVSAGCSLLFSYSPDFLVCHKHWILFSVCFFFVSFVVHFLFSK